jgi:hypothetical protein
MRTARNGNGRCGQSETAPHLIHLMDGRSVQLDVVNSLNGRRNGHVIPTPAQSLPHETQFEVLPDGTLIDLVRESSGDLGFVVCRNSACTFQRSFRNGDATLVPPKVHRSFVDALHLPKSLGTSETAEALLREIDDVLCTYLDFNEPDRKLVVYFSLYTWLNDLLHVGPLSVYRGAIWVWQNHTSSIAQCDLPAFNLCRRRLAGGAYTLITNLRPTLLLDEFELGADTRSRMLQRLLRNGSSMGQRIFRGSRAYDVFGPKAIASRQGAGDAALESRGLVVVSRPPARAPSVLDPKLMLLRKLRTACSLNC